MRSALLTYYAREGFWGHVEHEMSKLLATGITENSRNHWWRAIAVGFLAMMSSGKVRLGEVVRELTSMKSKRDLELPSIVALIHFHKVHDVVDHQEVDELESELSVAEGRASAAGIMLAAQFHWYASLRERDIDVHYERLDAARRLLRLVVPAHVGVPTGIQKQALCLIAWVDMSMRGTSRRAAETRHGALRLLQAASFDDTAAPSTGVADSLTTCGGDIETSLAKAAYFGMMKQFELAIEHLNHAIAVHSWLPALLEKAKLLMAIGDWEQASESIGRAGEHNGGIGALRLSALYTAIRVADESVVVREISALAHALAHFEGANSELAFETAKALARVTGSRRRVATRVIATEITEKLAVGMNTIKAEYIAELGHQHAMLGNYTAALASYRDAGVLDATNETVVYGILGCQIGNGDYDDAEQQLDFLAALGDSMGSTALLPFYTAKLRWRSRRDKREHLDGLAKAERLHFAAGALPQQTASPSWLLGGNNTDRSNIDGFAGSTSVPPAFSVFNVYDMVTRCDPEFVLALAAEYLEHVEFCDDNDARDCLSSGSDESEDEEVRAAVSRGIEIAECIAAKLNGDIEAKLLVANAKYATGNYEGAQCTLARALDNSPKCADAHLLLARVALAKANLASAHAGMERAVACDFGIRKTPLYHLVKADIHSRDGEHSAALELLETAVHLPGVRELPTNTGSVYSVGPKSKNPKKVRTATAKSSNNDYSFVYGKQDSNSMKPNENAHYGVDQRTLSQYERVRIFVDLAKTQMRFSQFEEAHTTLAEARERFQDTPEGLRIMLAMAELEVRRNGVEAGVRVLDSVSQSAPGYVRAQIAKARLFLEVRRDRAAYTQVHQDLAHAKPTAASYERLGGALVRINAPEAAIEAFDRAKELNARSVRLASKIGRAVVATHNYHRATKYYLHALQTHADDFELRRDLAKLYTKFHNFDDASRIVAYRFMPPDTDQRSLDLDTLLHSVRTLVLLAEIATEKNTITKARDFPHRRDYICDDSDHVLQASSKNALPKEVGDVEQRDARDVATLLLRAHDLQCFVLEKLYAVVDNEAVSEQKKILATICKRIAEYYASKQNRDGEAIKYYKEALCNDPVDTDAMIAIARVFLTKRHDIEACDQQYHAALRVDPSSYEVKTLAAELLILKQDNDRATLNFRSIVEANSTNYAALLKLVALLRRSGKLDDVPRFLALADREDARALAGPGLNVCKGLHARYRNDIIGAINHFNLARRDGHWGIEALANMIELYLYPDNEILLDTIAGTSRCTETSRVAGNLDVELASFQTPTYLELKIRVLRAHVKLVSRNSTVVDEALQIFIDALDFQKDFLPAILGMAAAFMLEDAPTKARNALKRVAKMPYHHEWACEFERGYLLLANIYIEKSKFDLAEDLCNVRLPFLRIRIFPSPSFRSLF